MSTLTLEMKVICLMLYTQLDQSGKMSMQWRVINYSTVSVQFFEYIFAVFLLMPPITIFGIIEVEFTVMTAAARLI